MADNPTFGAPEAFSYLTSKGYSPVQAAAIVGNIQQESSFNPASVNQKEGAEGLIQWRLDRLDNLKKFAGETGRSYTDPTAQLDFIGKEMTGPEARAGGAFMQATDLPSANAALKSYIRYGDNSQDARLKYASSALGGGSPGGASNAPAPFSAAQQTPVPSYNQPPQQTASLPAYSWSPGQVGQSQQPASQAAPSTAQPAPLKAMSLPPQLLALLHPSLRSMLSRG